MQRVPVDRPALQELAETTKGHYYEAASAEALQQVYQDMGSSIGYRTGPREIAQWFVGIGLLFALAAAGDEPALDLPPAVSVGGDQALTMTKMTAIQIATMVKPRWTA